MAYEADRPVRRQDEGCVDVEERGGQLGFDGLEGIHISFFLQLVENSLGLRQRMV